MSTHDEGRERILREELRLAYLQGFDDGKGRPEDAEPREPRYDNAGAILGTLDRLRTPTAEPSECVHNFGGPQGWARVLVCVKCQKAFPVDDPPVIQAEPSEPVGKVLFKNGHVTDWAMHTPAEGYNYDGWYSLHPVNDHRASAPERWMGPPPKGRQTDE